MTHTLPPPPAPAPPRAELRFFAWMRSRGIPRRHGWVGGVCSGLAARMGVDPLVVRGIFVVAALLALPALLVYAIAWALMPDEEGRIHLEQLTRGRFDPAMVAILIAFAIGLVPVVPLVFFGSFMPPDLFFGPLVAVLVLGLLTWLIVWAVGRRSRRRWRAGAGDVAGTSDVAQAGDLADLGGIAASRVNAATSSTPGAVGGGGETDDGAASPGETAGDLDAPASPEDVSDAALWREQQREWREQHDAWRRAQTDADRVIRDQARAERAAQSAAFAAESAARRAVRRASNPRASGAFTLGVIGSALVLGTGVGLVLRNGPLGTFAPTIGLLVAASAAAIGMIVAGLVRRRSGFLAFLTATLLVLGLTAPAFTGDRVLVLHDIRVDNPASETFLQPWATFQLFLHAESGPPAVDSVRLIKGSGWTYVVVDPGVELTLRARLGNVTLITQRGIWDDQHPLTEERELVQADGGTLHLVERTFSASTPLEGSSAELRAVTLELEQRTGEVTVIVAEPAPDDSAAEPEAAPAPAPAPEEDGE